MPIGLHPPPPRTNGVYTVKSSARATVEKCRYQAVWVDSGDPVFYLSWETQRQLRIYGHTVDFVQGKVAEYMGIYMQDITYRESDPEELTTAYKKR